MPTAPHRLYTNTDSGGLHDTQTQTHREYRAADRLVAADELYRDGVSGMARRAHRRGWDRAISACAVGELPMRHGRHLRHTLRRDAADIRGAGARKSRRRARRDAALRGLRAVLRLGVGAGAVAAGRAGGLSLHRRRADCPLAAHFGARDAVHLAVRRVFRLLHGLRAGLEADVHPFRRAACRHRAGRVFSARGARR